MRDIKRGTNYLSLLETVYSTSNISQAIKLDLSYKLNDMTLQLNDDEDLKALMAASIITKEMVRVQVEKASLPPPTSAPATAVIEVGASDAPATSIAKADKVSERKKKRAMEKAKKESETQAPPSNADNSKTSTATVPPVEITAANGATNKEGVTANDSVVSLDTSEDIPLAKVVFKNSEAPSKVSEPASMNEASNDKVEKPKRKRRTPEQIVADKLADEAKKEAVKVEKAEKKKRKLAENRKKAKEERQAKAAAEDVASKSKAQTVVSVDIPPQTPAPKAADQSSTKTAETIPGDKTADVAPKNDTASSTKKKKSPKKNLDETEAVAEEMVEPPSATPKVKRAKKSSKEQPTPGKEPEEEGEAAKASEPAKKNLSPSKKETSPSKKEASPSKKGSESNGIDSEKGNKSMSQTCEICFELGHSKPYCPIITAGREAVQKE